MYYDEASVRLDNSLPLTLYLALVTSPCARALCNKSSESGAHESLLPLSVISSLGTK
jgi:hypothetical protein